MKTDKERPVGIFDSGIGGLTVAHAIKEVLPYETLVYFGDTAHLPYGDKSEAAVQAYSVKIAQILLEKQCKVIVIACSSASSAAYELLAEYVGKRAKVINAIDPMVAYLGEHFEGKKVGLIGTKRTVNSNVYARKVEELAKAITLTSLATPLLAPMVEEGFFNNKISHEIIAEYLGHPHLQDIEALILGCTHYPLIREEIRMHYPREIEILDSSRVTAHYLKEYLVENGLANDRPSTAKDHFLVSDFTKSFEASARLFFKEEVHLENYPLWD